MSKSTDVQGLRSLKYIFSNMCENSSLKIDKGVQSTQMFGVWPIQVHFEELAAPKVMFFQI